MAYVNIEYGISDIVNKAIEKYELSCPSKRTRMGKNFWNALTQQVRRTAQKHGKKNPYKFSEAEVDYMVNTELYEYFASLSNNDEIKKRAETLADDTKRRKVNFERAKEANNRAYADYMDEYIEDMQNGNMAPCFAPSPEQVDQAAILSMLRILINKVAPGFDEQAFRHDYAEWFEKRADLYKNGILTSFEKTLYDEVEMLEAKLENLDNYYPVSS